MDLATIIGLLVGIGLIGAAIVMGGDPSGYIDLQSVFITVGGTVAALVAGTRLSNVIRFLKLLLLVVKNRIPDSQQLVQTIVELGQRARRDGLLALDDEAQQIEDPFLRKGLELVVDGTEPDVLREVLEVETAAMDDRHQEGIGLFRKLAAAAPAFGMIGTLIGLIRMLACLDDPKSIGPGLATALLTTLYGTLMANLFFTPMANKLECLNDREVAYRQLCQTGLLALQAGDSPRFLERKLTGYLEPRQRALESSGEAGAGDLNAAAEEAMASD